MISEFTKTAVPQLVGHELEYSKTQHEERFHSLHEAESVIREELEELAEELESCWKIFEKIHECTREDTADKAADHARAMFSMAVYAAHEAIQLAAMCEKLKEMGGKEDEKAR